MQRFREPNVLIYDRETAYRPDLLEKHVDFAEMYLAERKEAAERGSDTG
jgi:hypothetical protein